MLKKFIATILLSTLACSVFSQQKEQRVALVIGNSSYKSSPLNNPVNDARDMANSLRGYGFTVIERTNLTTRQVGQTLREFRSKLTPSSVAVVFYAGHGVQIKGENYLPTVDAEINGEEDVPTQSLSTRQLMDILADAKTRMNLVFLDACRDNPYARGFRSGSRGIAKENAPSGTLISFATRPGSVAADGDGRNGLYTSVLLQQIKQSNQPIEQVLKRVVSGVKVASKGQQEPWMEGSIEGDFCFGQCGAASLPISIDNNSVQADKKDPEEEVWGIASRLNKQSAYQAYLDAYPAGRYKAAAEMALAEFSKTSLSNSTTAFSSTTTNGVLVQGKLSGDSVKIGVLTDLSGVYAEYGGPGAVTAAKMAVRDFGGKIFGKPIEVVSADHQNKPDVAKKITQQWFDREGVDMTVENLNSAVALTVQALGKEKNKITIVTGAATARITNEDCAPGTGVHYLMDTIAINNALGKSIVRVGGDSWFFLTADYPFGHSLEKEMGDVVKASGGTLKGFVRHSLSASDFSSYLSKAQSSGAKVVGLINAGSDTVNSIKAAAEFGFNRKQNLAALLMLITDVHAIGLNTAQGLYLTESWYWDLNPESRIWSQKYEAEMKKKPNSNHASVYSSTMHYLKAVQAAGTDDTAAVMKKMKELPINDMFAKNGKLRADGRMVHDMYLFQVKKPSESKGPWDYYNFKGTIKGDDAFQSLSLSRCASLVN